MSVTAKKRLETHDVSQRLVTETCCNCGMMFAMTEDFRNDRLQRRQGAMTFYCPRGHAQHYTGESEEVKLRRERDRLKQEQAYLEDRRRAAEREAAYAKKQAQGYKGHATKLAKRAKAGLCPCCNRSFGNLRDHMATQHPAFAPPVVESGEKNGA